MTIPFLDEKGKYNPALIPLGSLMQHVCEILVPFIYLIRTHFLIFSFFFLTLSFGEVFQRLALLQSMFFSFLF